MAKIVADIHKGGTGKATIAAHVGFLAADRGAKTLPVDLDAQGNASDSATQRGLHPALIRMESELLDDVGFDKSIFYAAENLVTPDCKLRLNFSAQARNQPAKLLDTRSPP